MSVTLSEAAAVRIRQYLSDRAIGLRFGVRKTGCSGWAYEVAEAESLREGDQIFEDRGVHIVVDAASLPLVDGTEIDFAQRGLGSEFVFNNPKATALCGCGESFTIEERFADA
ncbi:MAG: iron-sulfur cluster assembly accessory protein [Xanthomonadales bacterium]|nr:iron-sulfur cluster assembly accessory protein [Xanthomonadales bacterium]MCB1629483.1 iron-sulfur cluster assembly accessory protein [Xanthomonadales bacterium]